MTTADIQQRVDEADQKHVHTHHAAVHTQDQHNVSHHHRGGAAGVVGEFEHRAFWHTHAHNHLALIHGHEYDHDGEGQEHGREAHIHDHADPTAALG